MNPFETQIIRVSDPLSAHGRSLRKSLLLSSIVSAAVAQAGFFPTKISALGLEFTQADRLSVLWLLAIVVTFFLISFIVVAWGDYAAWRMAYMAKAWNEDSVGYENLRRSILEDKKLTDEDREALSEQERRVGAMWRNAGYVGFDANVERMVRPLSWARVAVEFGAPFIAACASLYLLYRTTP